MSLTSYDVIIVGGGMVGLALAALLTQNHFSVAVIEAREFIYNDNQLPIRVSSIHATSKKLFDYIGAWSLLEKTASRVRELMIWDHTQRAHLHFDSATINEPQVSWIIENSVIINALRQVLHGHIDLFCPSFVTDTVRIHNHIQFTLNNGAVISGEVIVGADGAHSKIRDQMPIQLQVSSYQQKAIVGVIETQQPHNHVAYQKFLTTGPVALLPLTHPHHTSLVWSADDEISDALMKKTQHEFNQALISALDFKLGKLTLLTERHQFSLTMRHASDYVSQHYAVVGDAAHTIHPLAGLGVNLGLMDAACLAQTLIDARAHQKSLGDLRVLRRYTRWRKANNQIIMSAMRALKEIFAANNSACNAIRSAGVNILNQNELLKTVLMRIAMGQTKDLPDFLKI